MTSENEFIASEIRKSGYPLEVEVAELLETCGWEVFPSLFYEDKDEEEFKEIDILAYRQIAGALKGSPNYPYSVTIAVLLECKKRENLALVFFPRQRKLTDLDFGGHGLAAIDSFLVAKVSSYLTKSSLPRRYSFGLSPRAFVPIPIANQLSGLHQLPDLVGARDFRCLSPPEKSLSFDVAKLSKSKSGFNRNQERQNILLALNGLAKATTDRLEKQADLLQALLSAALNDSVVEQQPHLRQFSIFYQAQSGREPRRPRKRNRPVAPQGADYDNSCPQCLTRSSELRSRFVHNEERTKLVRANRTEPILPDSQSEQVA
jgi:hypothetical protein